jgi:hypothetical protein
MKVALTTMAGHAAELDSLPEGGVPSGKVDFSPACRGPKVLLALSQAAKPIDAEATRSDQLPGVVRTWQVRRGHGKCDPVNGKCDPVREK